MNFTQEQYDELYDRVVKQVQIWEREKENKSVMGHTLLADRIMKTLSKKAPHE